VPPLARRDLQQALADFPQAIAELLMPPQEVLDRCFSLPLLPARQRQELQRLWDGTAPPPPARS
jgi:hypothetical protein